jgi:hypothetical protein
MLASGRAAAEASDSTESAAIALEISIIAKLEGCRRVCVVKVWMSVMERKILRAANLTTYLSSLGFCVYTSKLL